MSKQGTLVGEVAIVTGGGRGVGKAIALDLAAAGASVSVVGRSREQLDEVVAAVESAGGQALAIAGDVTDQGDVDSLAGTTEAQLGPPTLLVNNAGVWGHVGPLEDADPGAWWRDVEVSLKGTFLCTRAVLPGMRARARGRIVNLSSYAAIAPRPYATAYACAKAALLRLTDSLAGELAGSGVSVFAVTPGFVRTELVEHVAASPAGRRYLPELAARTDAIDPGEIGRLVVEIASGRLDPLNGRFLHVLDDVNELLDRLAEIETDDLYALRLRRLPDQTRS